MRKLILLYWGTVLLMYLSQQSFYKEAVPNSLSGHTGRKHFIQVKSDVLVCITIIWLTCFSFLRTAYNDTGAYIDAFNGAKTVGEGLLKGSYFELLSNPLSNLYRDAMRSFTANYHIYFLVPALLNTVAFIKLFDRYSISPAFSLLVFVSLGTYITYIASLKQSLAMFFLLVSIPYALDGKYVKFAALIAVAMLFHTYAIMFALVPLLMGKPWGKSTWVLLGIMAFTMVTYDQTFGALIEYVETYGGKMRANEVLYEAKLNILRILVYWVPGIIALIFNKRLFRSTDKVHYLFCNLSMVGAMFLTLGLVKGGNLMARMAAYFEFGTCITLPWMIIKLFAKRSATVVFVIAIVMYFGYFIYEFALNKNFDQNYAAISLLEFFLDLFRK